jgi:hypothetical protein
MTLGVSETYGGLLYGEKDVGESSVEIAPEAEPVTWRIAIPGPASSIAAIEDLILVLEYRWQ